MNKYHKTPEPPKHDLERMYHADMMSQSEIAAQYGVTQKIVWRWFKTLGIKSRKPFKRNQIGSNNGSWKGDDATYAAFHYRVVSERGRPKECEVCGTKEVNKTYDWACVGDYTKTSDYKRMCRSCHWKHDKIANNFPNHKEAKSNASKSIRKHAK